MRFTDREGVYGTPYPFHPDKHPDNFSVSEAGYHCFACGASGGLWPLAEKLGALPRKDASHTSGTAGSVARVHACTRDGGDNTSTPTPTPDVARVHACTREGGDNTPTPTQDNREAGVARVHAHGREHSTPLPPTLENYAAKRLPVDFLASLGLVTVHLAGSPAVKMPYFDSDGAEIGARLRVAPEGRSRFKWRQGTRVQPYGLWPLDRSL